MPEIPTCPTCGTPLPHPKLGIALYGHCLITGAGKRIDLPRREAAILAALLAHYPMAKAKHTLIYNLYNGEDEPDGAENTLETHISKLRRKLKPIGLTIKNSRYTGYYLDQIALPEEAA